MILDLIIGATAVGVAVVGLLVVRRRVPLERLQRHHDVASVTYAVVGGLYSVILAFVLVSSWDHFEQARRTLESEVDALGNMWHHASGYSPDEGRALRRAIMDYAHEVIDYEWGDMSARVASIDGHGGYEAIWSAVLAIKPENDRQNSLWQITLGQLDTFGAARRERLLFANYPIPPAIWYFLVCTGVATVGFTYLFGMEAVSTQALITAALAGIIAGTLVLIYETQTPFEGALRISDLPIRRLVDKLRTEEAGSSACPLLENGVPASRVDSAGGPVLDGCGDVGGLGRLAALEVGKGSSRRWEVEQ